MTEKPDLGDQHQASGVDGAGGGEKLPTRPMTGETVSKADTASATGWEELCKVARSSTWLRLALLASKP